MPRTPPTSLFSSSSSTISSRSLPQPHSRLIPTSTALTHQRPMTSTPRVSAPASESDRATLRNALERRQSSHLLSLQRHRQWRTGDIYAPHDLSAAEQAKWKQPQRPTRDAFDTLNLDPLSCYKNFSILGEYVTEQGRIRHSKETGLRPVNQRKIAKAIRRAVGLGLMPSTHRHPEILKKEAVERMRRGMPA